MRWHPWRVAARLLVFLWNALVARLDFFSTSSVPGAPPTATPAPRGDSAGVVGNVFIAAAATARDTIRAAL